MLLFISSYQKWAISIHLGYTWIEFHSQICLDLNILKITICSDSERAQLLIFYWPWDRFKCWDIKYRRDKGTWGLQYERNDNRNPWAEPQQNCASPPKRWKKPQRSPKGIRSTLKPRLRRDRRHYSRWKPKEVRANHRPRRQRSPYFTTTKVI